MVNSYEVFFLPSALSPGLAQISGKSFGHSRLSPTLNHDINFRPLVIIQLHIVL